MTKRQRPSKLLQIPLTQCCPAGIVLPSSVTSEPPWNPGIIFAAWGNPLSSPQRRTHPFSYEEAPRAARVSGGGGAAGASAGSVGGGLVAESHARRTAALAGHSTGR